VNRQWVQNAGGWLRRHKVLLGILLFPWAVVLMVAGFLVAEHVRGRISLARYVHRLSAQGEKMSAEEFKLPPVTGENGAPEVLAAAKELKAGVVLPKTYPPRMRLTPAGHAIVCFREEQWVEDKVTNNWEQLASDLETNLATLERIRVAMAKPVLSCEFDPTLGPLARLPHISAPRTVINWLGSRIELGLHEGRTRETLQDLVTEIDLPRLLGRDGIVISELVRIAVASIARGDTWEALQADGWTDGDLARIQRTWERQEFANAMLRALEGERVFVQITYLRMRKSNQETAAIFFAMQQYIPFLEERPKWEQWLHGWPGGDAVGEFLKKQVYCRVWRFAWLDQDELHYLQYLEQLICLARDGPRQKSLQKLQPAADDLVLKFRNRGFYDRVRYGSEMFISSFSRIFPRVMRAETERSLVLAAVALKRYGVRHGGVPESLSALVPEFLSSVPVDYMDGQPLRFRRQVDGGFVLYSVGEDGKDDDGDASLRPGKTNLRMIWERKDVVWPAAAAVDEVEIYRAGSGKD
jgi:hypothetical protein